MKCIDLVNICWKEIIYGQNNRKETVKRAGARVKIWKDSLYYQIVKGVNPKRGNKEKSNNLRSKITKEVVKKHRIFEEAKIKDVNNKIFEPETHGKLKMKC